jgi:hypothetical protein
MRIELINLKSDININQKFSETNLQESYSCLPTEKFPVLTSFGLRMIPIVGSSFACEQFVSIMNNKKIKSRSRLTEGHLNSTMTAVASNISQRTDIHFRSKRCQISSQSTQSVLTS